MAHNDTHAARKKGGAGRILLVVLLLLLLAAGAAVLFAYNEIHGNGAPGSTEVTVSIPQGSGVATIANKLKEAEKPSLLRRFLAQLKDPMLLMLMAAAAISAVTNALSGESFTEVFIILAVVLLNAVLGVVQESKAEAAIEALQTMTAAKCKEIGRAHV